MSYISIDNREEFYKIIDSQAYKTCAEIGVQTGYFSEHLLKSKSLTKLYLIDCWTYQDNYEDMANTDNRQHTLYYQQVVNKFKQNSRVEIIKEFSLKASTLFDDNFFDFIYLDADHSYESVSKDIAHWYPKLRHGGTLAGHDYLDGIIPQGNFGVKKAVDQFTNDNNISLFVTKEEQWRSWYFCKL